MKKRMHDKSFSLWSQLVVILIIVLTIVISLSFFIQYRMSIGVLRNQKEKDSVSSFQQAGMNINSLLNNTDRASMQLLSVDQVKLFLQTPTTDQLAYIEAKMELYKCIDSTISNYNEISDILFYLNDGKYGGSSQPRTYFVYNNKSSIAPFYNSIVYANSKNSYSGIRWYGGYSRSLFYALPQDKQEQESSSGPELTNMIIIGARTIQLPTVKGPIVLVTCIKESTLKSYYEKLITNSDNNRILVLDEHGKYISGVDGSLYGRKAPYFDQIKQENGYGSLTYVTDNTSWQIIYYRLAQTGWFMINEVPNDIYQQDMTPMSLTLILVSFISLFLIVLFYAAWIRIKMKPLEKLVKTMKQIEQGNLRLRVDFSAGSREIALLNKQFNKMLEHISNLMDKTMKYEQEKRLLEIEALQSQINPHFIYNTLTTIRWMAKLTNANAVSNALLSFVNLLRPVFNHSGITWSIQNEIDFTKNYIDIMNIRFGGSITFTFNIGSFSEEEIPRFILQPLIENAITHGVSGIDNGIIETHIVEEGSYIRFIVKDNGMGMDRQKLETIRAEINYSLFSDGQAGAKSHSIGLVNVNRRIKLHFGERYCLSIDSEKGKGTVVSVQLPKKAL